MKKSNLKGKQHLQDLDFVFLPLTHFTDICLSIHFSFRLRYCPSRDRYYRSRDTIAEDTAHDIEGWVAGTAAVDSVFRKVEQDWKMVRNKSMYTTLVFVNTSTATPMHINVSICLNNFVLED